jgi:DUF3014 family protein
MEHVEPLDHDADFDRPIDPRRNRSKARNIGWPLVMIAAVALAGYFVWRGMHSPEPASAPAAAPPTPAQTSNEPSAPVGPKYPIEAVAPATEQTPLPAPADSDTTLQEALATLFAGAPLDRVFYLEQIVPRFVATIDNLPRQTVALQKMPVKPVGGAMDVSSADGRVLLRADNAERYAMYVRMLEQADTQRLVQAYARLYPLFQKAYQDLGYPQGYFNDRLVEVIDHLLATPDVPAPVELSQPKVLYEYADPSLEARSAGQKILIRMGPVNESRVKTKLREIRRALTGQALPR